MSYSKNPARDSLATTEQRFTKGRVVWPSLALCLIAPAVLAQTDSATMQVQFQSAAGIQHTTQWQIVAPPESLIAAAWFESYRPASTICLFFYLRDSTYLTIPLIAGGEVPALCAARAARRVARSPPQGYRRSNLMYHKQLPILWRGFLGA